MFQQSLDNFKAAIEMSLGIAVLETLLASIIYLFEIYCGFSRTVLIHEQNFCQLNIINTKCIAHIRPKKYTSFIRHFETTCLPYSRFNWFDFHTQIDIIMKIISFLYIFHFHVFHKLRSKMSYEIVCLSCLNFARKWNFRPLVTKIIKSRAFRSLKIHE